MFRVPFPGGWSILCSVVVESTTSKSSGSESESLGTESTYFQFKSEQVQVSLKFTIYSLSVNWEAIRRRLKKDRIFLAKTTYCKVSLSWDLPVHIALRNTKLDTFCFDCCAMYTGMNIQPLLNRRSTGALVAGRSCDFSATRVAMESHWLYQQYPTVKPNTATHDRARHNNSRKRMFEKTDKSTLLITTDDKK